MEESFLLSISRIIHMLLYPLTLKKISGLWDATNYLSIALILILPIIRGMHLLNGKFMDHLPIFQHFPSRYMFRG